MDFTPPELPDGREITLPGRGTTFVRSFGQPVNKAPTVLLSHGWFVNADLNWCTAYATLAKRFHVVTVDHRGHGRGIVSRRRFRLSDCANDAVAVLDALEIERAIAVGYSMGGPIALKMWKQHRGRIDGLVLCATSAKFRQNRVEKIQFPLFRPLSVASGLVPAKALDRIFAAAAGWEAGDRFGPWVVEQVRQGNLRMLVEAGSAIGGFNALRWATEIDVPTALVITERDTIVDPKRQWQLAKAIAEGPHPDPTHVVSLDGDHDVCLLDGPAFAAAVLEATEHVAANI